MLSIFTTQLKLKRLKVPSAKIDLKTLMPGSERQTRNQSSRLHHCNSSEDEKTKILLFLVFDYSTGMQQMYSPLRVIVNLVAESQFTIERKFTIVWFTITRSRLYWFRSSISCIFFRKNVFKVVKRDSNLQTLTPIFKLYIY
jgi:hypothetical protein